MKGWKKIVHVNSNQMRTGMIILVSYKMDFNSKTVMRDKKNFIMIKVQFTWKIHTYIIIRDFNTPLTMMNRISSSEKPMMQFLMRVNINYNNMLAIVLITL